MFRHIDKAAGSTVPITVDGFEIQAVEGEPLAAAILRTRQPYTRTSVVSGEKRAPYCMMGVCFECLATVDGVPSVQTCAVTVRAGMAVTRQNGAPEVAAP